MITEDPNWLSVALILTGRIFLLGFAWCWLMPSSKSRVGSWLIHGVQPLLIGLPLLLMIRLVSAESLLLPRLLPELLAIFGIITGLVFRREKMLRRIAPTAALFFFVSVASTVILFLPHRSEWVVGGWDPGIYVNEGANLALLDTYQHEADPFFSALDDDELKVFTRWRLPYLEAHPVVILEPETRSLKRFFFPLTSTLIAEYIEAGGLHAGTRINYFLGLFCTLIFAAMLCAFRAPFIVLLLSTACLVTQPVWLYHLNIPTSEMLQLFFVCGLGLLLPHLRSHPTVIFIFGMILVCAGMNRFGFLPFGTLLCCILALKDLGTISPVNGMKLRLCQLIPIWMGAGHCAFHNAITLNRLEDLTPMIFASGLVFTFAALIIDFIGGKNAAGVVLKKLYAKRFILPLTAVALTGFVLIAGMSLANLPLIVAGMTHYISIPLLVLAALGLGGYFFDKFSMDENLFAMITFLACSTVLVLLQSEIAPLLPWASRRLMMYTVPLVALLAGLVIRRTFDKHMAIPTVLIILILGLNARKGWQAANVQEYVGVTAHLDAIAEQIGPNDLVVADHFLWSTPLRMAYGKNVINGEVLWQEAGADTQWPEERTQKERFNAGMAILYKMQEQGKIIRFLTSSEKLLTVYPGDVTADEDWQSDPIDYQVLSHHPKGRGFVHTPRHKQFSLFTLKERP